MQSFPHQYKVQACSSSDSNVTLSSGNKPDLESAPPIEFGGPGNLWSPEDMLVAAVADCFILTFKAIAQASKLPWQSLSCNVEGTLNNVDRVIKFTEFKIFATLTIEPTDNTDKAARTLEKAEKSCLISNSLAAPSQLEYEIVT